MSRSASLAVKQRLISKRGCLYLAMMMSFLCHIALIYYPVQFASVQQLVVPVFKKNETLDVNIVWLEPAQSEFVEPLVEWPKPIKSSGKMVFAENATPTASVLSKGIADPTYYAPPELDVLPKVQQEVELYSQEILRSDVVGELVLRLWLNENGSVEKVEVIKSELPEMFVTTAVNGFNRAVFSPAKKQGRAVKARLDIGWVFSGAN